jgi:signal recognition particle subunit SRP54
MVLAQLGGSISRALAQMSNATVIDEKVLGECLNEISRALLQSDVQFKMVRDMQTNIRKIVNLETLAAGTNKRRIIQQVALCRTPIRSFSERGAGEVRQGADALFVFFVVVSAGRLQRALQHAGSREGGLHPQEGQIQRCHVRRFARSV